MSGRAVAAGLALVALTAATYAPSLRNDFVYDDHQLVVNAPRAESFGEVLRVFTERHWPTLPYYRPIPRFTMVGQKFLHGNAPAPYHALNLALIAVAAWLAYGLLRLPAFGLPAALAWLGAALFSVHPIASACVYPICSGRETLIPAVFALGAVSAFLRAGRAWYAAALGLLACALLSKEQAVVVPALFALADAARLSAEPPRGAIAWLRRYAPVVAVLGLYLGLRSLVLGGESDYRLAFLARPAGPLLSLEYTLQTALAPFAPVVYEPVVEVWRGGWRSLVWPLAVVFAIAAALRSDADTRRRALFWSAWALLALLPTANLLEQQARFAERYGFLSLLGLVAAAATLAAPLWARPASRRAVAAGAGVAVVACAVISFERAGSYANQVRFLEQWLRSDPDAGQAHLSFAQLHRDRGDRERAIHHYTRALATWPLHVPGRHQLAALLREQGRLDEAEIQLRGALRLDPSSAPAHYQLGLVLLQRGEQREAAEHFAETARLDPEHPKARQLLERMRATQ